MTTENLASRFEAPMLAEHGRLGSIDRDVFVADKYKVEGRRTQERWSQPRFGVFHLILATKMALLDPYFIGMV